jgi:hypothetical protein
MADKDLIFAPVVEIGEYSPYIPFNRSLFVAEHRLTSNDRLTPALNPSGPLPIRGATTIYRLIGDGAHSPSIDPNMENIGGILYNPAVDVVNLVVFSYDGIAFTYTIAQPLVVEESYNKSMAIGDYGHGDGIIVPVINPVGSHLPLGLYRVGDAPGAYYVVSMFDLVKSIHYTGEETLVYRISKDGLVWVEDTNPKLAQLMFSCAEAGFPFTVQIQVTDGNAVSSDIIQMSILISDVYFLCGPH